MNKRKIFSFFIFLILFFSCKEKVEEEDPSVRNLIQDVFFPKEPPVLLMPKLKNKNCDEKKGMKNLGKVGVTLYNHDKKNYEMVERDLSSVAGNPVRSSFISSVEINYHEIRELDGCAELSSEDSIGFRCTKVKTSIENEGDKVSLCSGEYAQDDLENHILAGVFAVESTLQCAQKMGIKVNPLVLRFYPIVEKKKSDLSFIKTDNAYWSYSKFYGNETLNFLPHTKGSLAASAYNPKAFDFSMTHKERSSSSPLSYQYVLNKAVTSHEASHHVFDHLARSSLMVILESKKQSFYETHGESAPFGTMEAMSKNLKIYDAFNEFAADKIAELCHPNNSTASVRFTGTKDEKVLTEKKLKGLLGESTFSSGGTTHSVGAIIGNALNEYWLSIGIDLLKNKKQSDFVKAKKHAMEALANFGSIIPSKNPREYLIEGFYSLIEETIPRNKKGLLFLKKSSCDVFDARLPAISSDLKKKFLCEN